MKKGVIFFLSVFLSCSQHILSLKLSDYVAQAVGEDETNDDIKNKVLFLTKSLQVNNHPDAKLASMILLRSKYFKGDKEVFNAELAAVPMAGGGGINAEQYKGHQGPQAIDDMITMFTSGPGAAIYSKLAPTQQQVAIKEVVNALETTKLMLR